MINRIKIVPERVKASFGYFFASVVTSGIAYVTTPIYTRILSPEAYGQTSVFLTWLQLFGIIAMFSLQAGVFNNGMLEFPEDRDGYSYSMLVLSNCITLIFFAILFLLYPCIHNILDIDVPLLLLMMFVFLTQPAYNFWTSRQRYECKYKKTVIVAIITAILSPTVAIMSILLSDNKIYARLFGAEIPLVIVYLFFYYYLTKNAEGKLNIKYWKDALLFNLPLIPHYLSAYILGSSDRIMIANLVGNTQAAYYSVAHSIAMFVSVIWSAANASLVPYTYEKCKEKDFSAISRTTLPILFLFAIACIFIILIAPELLFFMASKEYQQAVYVVPPIIGGVFFQVQYYMYSNVLYYKKKTTFVMLASLTSASLNIVLNYLFIPKFGFVAAGYTTIVSYGLQALIDYRAMRKVMNNSIYNMKYVIGISFAVVVFSIISGISYKMNYLRYTLLVTIIVIVILFRKKVKAIIGVFFKNDHD